ARRAGVSDAGDRRGADGGRRLQRRAGAGPARPQRARAALYRHHAAHPAALEDDRGRRARDKRAARAAGRFRRPATAAGAAAMIVRRIWIVLLLLLIAAGLAAANSVFLVDQTSQAIVERFGRPVRVVRDPGLALKAPWDTLVRLDKRDQGFDADPATVS